MLLFYFINEKERKKEKKEKGNVTSASVTISRISCITSANKTSKRIHTICM